jgi:hypothetical protein
MVGERAAPGNAAVARVESTSEGGGSAVPRQFRKEGRA